MDVELSSTNTTLGSWPDCEAKKVTSPLSSALTLVGCTRLLTALLVRQSPGTHAAAVAGRGASRVASSIRTPIRSAGRRSWRSLMVSSQSVAEAEFQLEVAGDRVAAGDHHLVGLSAQRRRRDGVAQVAVARLRPADLRSRDSLDGLDHRKGAAEGAVAVLLADVAAVDVTGPVLDGNRLVEGELRERELAQQAEAADQVLAGGVDARSLAEGASVLRRLALADGGQPQGRERDQGEHPDDDQGGEQRAATMGAHHPREAASPRGLRICSLHVPPAARDTPSRFET